MAGAPAGGVRMTESGLDDLDSTASVLWPPNTSQARLARRRADRSRAPVAEYLLLPAHRQPRLLVPMARRPAAAFLAAHGGGRDRTARFMATALAHTHRVGLGPALWHWRMSVSSPRDGRARTIETYLSELLDSDVVLGIHLGAPRANRKPVLHVLNPAGRTLAFAKLGVDALTDRLVRHEIRTLSGLARAPMRHVRTAEVLHHGTWEEHSVLVQSALPVSASRGRVDASRLTAAVAEVAGLSRTPEMALGASEYLRDLRRSAAGLPPADDASALQALVRRLEDGAGQVPVAFGAAHGDWAPWNMAALGASLLVWDWERFRSHVPVGFDLLHYGLQGDLVAGRTAPRTSAHRCIREARVRLSPLGVSADSADVTALLYLADLAARYLTDRQREAGARMGDVGTWLLPALDEGVRDLEGHLCT